MCRYMEQRKLANRLSLETNTCIQLSIIKVHVEHFF